jgi:hypothetical protein
MTSDEFVTLYPSLFHMAADGAWPLILRHGLLSTSAVLDLVGLSGEPRRRLEEERRVESVTLHSGSGDLFVLRDQKPLHPGKLERCLVGMAVPEWLQLLNGKVFFWPTRRRCEELLAARAYRGRAHTVIEVDTARLLDGHSQQTALSPINAGAVLYNPPQRGKSTFVPLAEVPFEEWRRKRGRARAVAEVAVAYAVCDMATVTRAVFRAETMGWTSIWDWTQLT